MVAVAAAGVLVRRRRGGAGRRGPQSEAVSTSRRRRAESAVHGEPDRSGRSCRSRVTGNHRYAREPLDLGGARGARRAARALLDWLHRVARQDVAPIRLHRSLGTVRGRSDDVERPDSLAPTRSGLRFPGRPLALPRRREPRVEDAVRLRRQWRRGQAHRRSHQHACRCRSIRRTLPVFWLGPADAAQSLERVDALLRTRPRRSISRTISSPRPACTTPRRRLWRGSNAASPAGTPTSLRGDATEWIAWHPIAGVGHCARSHRAHGPQLARASGGRGSARRSRAARGRAGADCARAVAARISTRGARRSRRWGHGRSWRRVTRSASIARQDASLDIQREAVETLGDFEDQRGCHAVDRAGARASERRRAA